MTSLLSIDEGPDPKPIRPVDQTEEVTAPVEGAIKPDQAEEEIMETTATGIASTATSAKSRGTDKKNAGKG